MRGMRFGWTLLLLAALVGGKARCAGPESLSDPVTLAQATGQVPATPGGQPRPTPPAPAPRPAATPERPAPAPGTTTPATTPTVPLDQTAAAAPTPQGRTDVSRLARVAPLSMLGDQGGLGIPAIAFGPPGSPAFPPLPGPVRGAVLVPWVRSFKIGDDESPQPLDRVYAAFNYYDRLGEAVNLRLGSDLHDIRVYRELFGVEKTFLDGDASVELRLPLDTLSSASGIPGLGGSSTDVGDLTVVFKYALWQDRQAGDVFSAGLAVTAPTGPRSFAGSDTLTTFHDTTLQPFIGYLWRAGALYVHGFTAVDVPTDTNDVTMLYNDLGVGYYLYRSASCDRLLTAVVPTFEVHVNTPLDHRGAFRLNDPAATPDVVDLTTGATLEFNRRSTLAAAFVTPVTGPRPFDFEVLVQLTWRFGPRPPAASPAPPVLGE